MSDIRQKLPYDKQRNWGGPLNKVLLGLDSEVKNIKDELSKEKERLELMAYLSSGVYGTPSESAGRNVVKKGSLVVKGEEDFDNALSLSYTCYFSDDGKGVPVLKEVDSLELSAASIPTGNGFYPIYIFYNEGEPDLHIAGGIPVTGRPTPTPAQIVSHPWYILVGVVKRRTVGNSTSLTYIPMVSTSNKSASDKVSGLMNPRIASDRIKLKVSGDAWSISTIPKGGIYALMSPGINYPNINVAGDVAGDSYREYKVTEYSVDVIGDEGAGNYIGRLLLGNNKTAIVDLMKTDISDEAGIRGASFKSLPGSYIYGSYVEVARFAVVKSEGLNEGDSDSFGGGELKLYNTIGGGIPAINIPNISLSTDNLIYQDDLVLYANGGAEDRYRFRKDGAGGIDAVDDKITNLGIDTELGVDFVMGSRRVDGYDNPYYLLNSNLALANLANLDDAIEIDKDTNTITITGSTGKCTLDSNKVQLKPNNNQAGYGFVVRSNYTGGDLPFITVERASYSSGFYLTGNNSLLYKAAGSTRLTITPTDKASFTGAVEAPSFNATSDRRLKENIAKAAKKYLSSLPVYSYNLIDNPTPTVGIMAQDLQEVAPELVVEDADGYLSIKESKLVYYLMQEIKELHEKVAALEEVVNGIKESK